MSLYFILNARKVRLIVPSAKVFFYTDSNTLYFVLFK